MSNTRSNYPNNEISRLDGDSFTGDTINSLLAISSDHIPETVKELKDRIAKYFAFCGEHDLRPGVEALSLCLHINRKTLWEWCGGKGRAASDPAWRDVCINARQCITAFIEAASLAGRLNPATSCFLLKNWAAYQDSIQIDYSTSEESESESAAALPRFEAFGLIDTTKTEEG